MSDHLYAIQTERMDGTPLPNVVLKATSPTNGPWAATTNACGQAWPTLGSGHYSVDFVVSGAIVGHREWDLADPPTAIIRVGLDVPFPPAPSRDAVCRVRVGFQGMTIQTTEFGPIPAFGPETSSLSDADLHSYFQQVKAAGWTHVEFAVSWNYVEIGYAYPVPGRDLSSDLPELRRRIELAIQAGLFVVLFCAGDGESNPAGGYNDPQGWTYGRQWLMDNFARIYGALETGDNDLTPFMVFSPGYDGVWYGWKDAASVRAWWALAGGIINGKGYLAIEWGAGICHLGDGAATYEGDGQFLDVVLQEFPVGPLPSSNPDQVWQIAARTVPVYHRPADQPANDDPPPVPSYIHGTPRGPVYVVGYEYDTYPWVRNEISATQVQTDRAYLASVGYEVVC